MRDFRDAKTMAQTIRAALAAKGLKITISESLELIAKAFGAADWNTLSAAIKTASAEPNTPAGPLDTNRALDGLAKALGLENWDKLNEVIRTVRPRALAAPPEAGFPVSSDAGRTTFSAELSGTLHRAVGFAAEHKHGYTTLEHLLLSLIEDRDAAAVLDACQIDVGALATELAAHVHHELKNLTGMGENPPAPTAGFQRVVQRAVIHVQSSGRGEVTGANLLVAILSETESRAAQLLFKHELTRLGAVNFIAHGIRKDGGRAA